MNKLGKKREKKCSWEKKRNKVKVDFRFKLRVIT